MLLFHFSKVCSFDSQGYRDRNQISVVAKTFKDFVGNHAQQVLLPQRMLSRLVKVSTLRLWSVDSLAKKEWWEKMCCPKMFQYTGLMLQPWGSMLLLIAGWDFFLNSFLIESTHESSVHVYEPTYIQEFLLHLGGFWVWRFVQGYQYTSIAKYMLVKHMLH